MTKFLFIGENNNLMQDQ